MSCWRMGKWEQLYGNRLKEMTSMKNFTDVELTELADWAEAQERSEPHPDAKKAFGAIRQGADWLLRFRIKQAQQKLEQTGSGPVTLPNPTRKQ